MAAVDIEKRGPPMKVPGTMKLHAVVALSDKSLCTRQLSCNCEVCIQDPATSPCQWVKHTAKPTQNTPQNHQTPHLPVTGQEDNNVGCNHVAEEIADSPSDFGSNPTSAQSLSCDVDDWVAATYETKWYVGKVEDKDDEDSTVFVNFMTTCGKYPGLFKWPAQKDQLWINTHQILKVLEVPPAAQGKTKRCFKLEEAVIESINAAARRNEK